MSKKGMTVKELYKALSVIIKSFTNDEISFKCELKDTFGFRKR